MQTLTFVPTLLPATSAAPNSPPCPQRRASRARLRRRRSGESFKFGCKATGNRVHPLLRYRKIRFIVAWLSLSLFLPLSFMCGGQHAPHVAFGSRCYTLRSTLNAILLIIFIENYSQASVRVHEGVFNRVPIGNYGTSVHTRRSTFIMYHCFIKNAPRSLTALSFSQALCVYKK